jgi:hypothetical protein
MQPQVRGETIDARACPTAACALPTAEDLPMFRSHLLLGAALGCVAALPAWSAPLAVGSGNEAVIEPPVAHPAEIPCTVPLVIQGAFGANGIGYAYTPPASCPGPWAKVVLSMAFSLNEGRQFDRSGQLFLGGVPLWFGTTAEPRATLSPRWSFEKDVTDYTALFTTTQTGVLQVPNYQSSVYTSTITASATLLFYPVMSGAPAPVTADVVLPLPTGGGLATLNTGTDQLAFAGMLPTNILRATLDLYLQGQSNDEFWYFCVPTAVASELESCGNTAFREGEISVDGQPAGVAPIYPWIFTGGIDPYLWQPIPGVQTFDFTAFHADLSPFAGVLSNGAPHTIATSVFNANSYFSATGALRLFLDKGVTQVSGGITRDTLAMPKPLVDQRITTVSGVSSGTIKTSDEHDFTIVGTVTGSAGTTVNSVTQTTHFTNAQRLSVSATQDVQVATQATDTTITVASRGASNVAQISTLHYPLSITYDLVTNKDGNSTQLTKVDQQYLSDVVQEAGGLPVGQDSLANAIQSADTLFLNSAFSATGHKSQSETAVFDHTGTAVPCFKRTLVSTFSVLSAVQTGC